MALPKDNLERHFKMVHKATRLNILLKQVYAAEKSVNWRVSYRHRSQFLPNATQVRLFAKHKKPFKDGEFVKKAFVEAADALFTEFKKK